MKTFKLENGDIVLDDNKNFVMIEGADEENQCIERILTTRQGEWFLNILHGLDYSQIFIKPFNEERARLAIIEAVHQELRVKSVEEVRFDFKRNSRKLSVYIKVKMQSGNTIGAVIPLE